MKTTPPIVATSLVSRLKIAASEQHQEDQDQARAEFLPPPTRMLSGTLYSRRSGVLEAQHDHRQRLEDEAPDHAEGVGLAQEQHVAPAERRWSTSCRTEDQ